MNRIWPVSLAAGGGGTAEAAALAGEAAAAAPAGPGGSAPKRCCKCCNLVARLISVLLRLGRLPMTRDWLLSLEASSKTAGGPEEPLRVEDVGAGAAPGPESVPPEEEEVGGTGLEEEDEEEDAVAILAWMAEATSLYFGWDESAMSKRGWITSGGKTAFFCHRLSTRMTLLCNGKVSEVSSREGGVDGMESGRPSPRSCTGRWSRR